MKILVVYYSRTETTKKAAQELADKLKADIEEIRDSCSRKGVLGFAKCGKEAVTRAEPAIEDPDKKVSEYDLVVLGTPVWAGTMASPVRSYISKFKGRFPNVAFFSTQQSPQVQRVFKDMQELAGAEPKATLVLTTKEVAQDSYKGKVEEFVSQIGM